MLLGTVFEEKRVSIEDADEIIELINKYYSEENNRDFQRKWKDSSQFDAVRVQLKLRQNWSFGVFKKSSKKLVAVMLCCVQESNLEPTQSEIEKEELHLSTELQDLQEFFAKLEANVFEILNTKKRNGYSSFRIQKAWNSVVSFRNVTKTCSRSEVRLRSDNYNKRFTKFFFGQKRLDNFARV